MMVVCMLRVAVIATTLEKTTIGRGDSHLAMARVELGEESQAPVEAILESNPLVELLRRQLLSLGCREQPIIFRIIVMFSRRPVRRRSTFTTSPKHI